MPRIIHTTSTKCLLAFLLFAGLTVLGCNRSSPPQTQQSSPELAEDTGKPAVECETVARAKQTNHVPELTREYKEPQPPTPLTDQQIGQLIAQIEKEPTYSKRLGIRRQLFYGLARVQRLDEMAQCFGEILDDVAAHDGNEMTQRAAIADAATLQNLKDYAGAIRAYQFYTERFSKGTFVDEALFRIGECQLELTEYAQAEIVWQRLVEEHDASPLAPWGWRKLALAQLLRGQFDAALSTLDVLAEKFANSHWAEYAKMRRGYVLTAANRLSQAQAEYLAFLSNCAASRYCVLAQKQLAQLPPSLQ